MRNRSGFVLSLCLSTVCAAVMADEEPWRGDPMIVTATATDGGDILCFRSGCEGILGGLLQDSLFEQMRLMNMQGLLDSDFEPELHVERSEFCERLKDSRPQGCSKSSPPSVPALDPRWQPNGCGVGGWQDVALGLIAGLALPEFTGELDAPFPGVSFLGACNRHDQCYGIQLDKYSCDGRFREDMADACAGSTLGTALEICFSAGSAYHLAVTAHGDTAYESAGAKWECARWHLEMKINGCTES